MALPLYALKHLKEKILPILQNGSLWNKLENSKPKIAMLSNQDIIADPQDIFSLFNLFYIEPKFREDSEEIKKWHKADWIHGDIVDTQWLFEQLGFEFTCFDIVKARGNEVFLDLNFNLPEQFIGQFDLVFENCIEHCFNISTAFFNTFQLCKKGGIIYHLNPLNLINHGFYNVSPTFYHDVYSQNNCEILHYEAFQGIQTQEYFYAGMNKDNMLVRPKDIHPKSMQLCIVQKHGEPRTGLKIPVQSKFVKNPMSKLS